MPKQKRTPSKQQIRTKKVAKKSRQVVAKNQKAVNIAPKQPLLLMPPHRKRLWRKKVVWCLAFVLMVLAVLTALPKTRYAVPGLVLHKEVSVIVSEAGTGASVSEASIQFGNHTATTDQTGLVRITGARLGANQIKVSKPFYQDYETSKVVTLFKRNNQLRIELIPKGRAAQIQVKNRISGKPIANVLLRTGSGASARTDASGKARLMLPKNVEQDSVSCTGDTIQPATGVVWPVVDNYTNVVYAVPKGEVYWLQRNATLDIVKSSLDGTNKQTVLMGTGAEDADTNLVASPDWKFLALKSRREGVPKLYIYDTEANSLSTIEDAQTVQIVGWLRGYIVYRVDVPGAPLWQPKRSILKSYDVIQKRSVVLEESQAQGGSSLDFVAMDMPAAYVMGDRVVYTVQWKSSYYYGGRFIGKKMSLTTVQPDGTNKQVIRDWQAGYNASLDSYVDSAKSLALRVELDGVLRSYWRYQDGSLAEAPQLEENFTTAPRGLYLESPTAMRNMWLQSSGASGAVMVASAQHQNSKPTTILPSGFKPYGWFGDDIVLVSDADYVYALGVDTGKAQSPLRIGAYVPATNGVPSYGQGYQK